MSDAPEEPVDPVEDTAEADDGTVLSPDELDISEEENVAEIGDGRYVISPGNGPPRVDNVERPDQPTPEEATELAGLTDESVHEWLAADLESADSAYAFDVSACFEGRVEQNALYSNDVVTTFENLVTWYAQHAGGNTPVEEVLGLLLLESNLTIRFPVDSLVAFAESHDLDESAPLAALYQATREAGGLDFSPGRR